MYLFLRTIMFHNFFLIILDSDCRKIAASQVKIHDGSAYTSTIRKRNHQVCFFHASPIS